MRELKVLSVQLSLSLCDSCQAGWFRFNQRNAAVAEPQPAAGAVNRPPTDRPPAQTQDDVTQQDGAEDDDTQVIITFTSEFHNDYGHIAPFTASCHIRHDRLFLM